MAITIKPSVSIGIRSPRPIHDPAIKLEALTIPAPAAIVESIASLASIPKDEGDNISVFCPPMLKGHRNITFHRRANYTFCVLALFLTSTFGKTDKNANDKLPSACTWQGVDDAHSPSLFTMNAYKGHAGATQYKTDDCHLIYRIV